MSSKEALVCLGSRSGRWTFNNIQEEKHKWYEYSFCRRLLFGASALSHSSSVPQQLLLLASTWQLVLRGGVPLLDAFEQTTSLPFFQHYTFNTKRYTVGPAVDVSLPLKLRFEADGLYTRLDYDSTVMGVDTFTRSATRANSWQFPLLLKKEIPVERVRPFGGIGYALRHVSGTSHIVDIVFPTWIIDQTADSPELVQIWVSARRPIGVLSVICGLIVPPEPSKRMS